MFPLVVPPLYKLKRPMTGMLLGIAVLSPVYADDLDNPPALIKKAPLAMGYSVVINNTHIGDLVLTAKNIKTDVSLQAFVESRGLLSLLKPTVYYYSYNGADYHQISVSKKRYKRYHYSYNQPLSKTLYPVVNKIQYDNGKGGQLPSVDAVYQAGHTFLSLVGAVMQGNPVPSQYVGCPKSLQGDPIKLFTGKKQSQFVISGDTVAPSDFKGDGGNIFSPAYACHWSLKHIYGDDAKADYYNGSQTWFARFGDDGIFPLYHRTKNRDGSVEIKLLGVLESGQWLYGEMPNLAEGEKYRTLWRKVLDYKNKPYSQ